MAQRRRAIFLSSATPNLGRPLSRQPRPASDRSGHRPDLTQPPDLSGMSYRKGRDSPLPTAPAELAKKPARTLDPSRPRVYRPSCLVHYARRNGAMSTQRFIVISNTPGYLPEDDDPFITDDYDAAVQAMHDDVGRYVEQIEDYGDGKAEVSEGWASPNNYAAVMVYDSRSTHDLGRYFGVEQYEDDEGEQS